MFEAGDVIVGTQESGHVYSLTNQTALMEVEKVGDRGITVVMLNSIQRDWRDIYEFIGMEYGDLRPDLFRLAESEDLIKFNKGVKYEYQIH